jgi:hypothetical protein
MLMFVFMCAGLAFAELAKPKIYPQEGQTKEQEKKDTQECYFAATRKTGIDPDVLEIKMDGLGSAASRAAMPGPRGGLTLGPGRSGQVSEYKERMEEVEDQYRVFLGAFAGMMNERGYKVKYKGKEMGGN